MILYEWLTEIDKVDEEELLLDIQEYVKSRLRIVKAKNYTEGVQLNQLGDRIEQGDDLDGATLCDWCNMHFKGDGQLTRCNECEVK